MIDDMLCFFCGAQTSFLCDGCGFAICPECDNEPDVDGPHEPQAHQDTDEEGYEE